MDRVFRGVIMKKKMLIICSVVALVITTLSTIGYWQLKNRLPQLLELTMKAARAKGVSISFQQVVPPQGAIIDLKNLKISGKTLGLSAHIDSLKLQTSWKPSFPPLSLTLLLHHPVILKSTNYDTIETDQEVADPSTAQPPPSWLAAVLIVCPIKISVTDLEALPWGLKKASGSVTTKDLSLSWSEGANWTLLQHVEVTEWAEPKLSIVPTITTDGLIALQPHQASMSKTTVAVGPFKIQASGKYDLKNQKWALDLEMPTISFRPTELSPFAAAVKGLKSAEGSVYFRLSSQGLGSDPNSIYSDGELRAEKVSITTERDDVEGKINLNLSSNFSKKESLVIDADLDINLDDSSLTVEKKFRKPRKTPLNGHFSITGKNDQFLIQNGKINFNNLMATFKGSVLNGPKLSTKIDTSIAKTSLKGWEQFIPSLTNVRTAGYFEGDISYSGTIDNWKQATIDLSMKAKDVEVPILKDWLGKNDLSISGIARVDSETRISISQGALKTLLTDTALNLSDNQIVYSDVFSKTAGTPMSAKLNIKSNAQDAQIKNGAFVLGPLHGSIEGKITDLTDPKAQLKLRFGNVAIKDLVALSPMMKDSSLRILTGELSSTTTITGPLLSKETAPTVKLDASLSKADINWAAEPNQNPLEMRNIRGHLSSTANASGMTELKMDAVELKVFNGTLGMKMQCKGGLSDSRCSNQITVRHLAADKAIEFMSPKSAGLVKGKIDSEFSSDFRGFKPEGVQKTLVGKGRFTLTDGEFNTINLIEKPLENLKKVPIISNLINNNVRNQPIKQTTGEFEIREGKTVFSQIKMTSPYFDLTSPSLTVDMNKNISAKMNWIPKESILSRSALDIIRDDSGRPSVPIIIQGPANSPSITVDEAYLQSRLTNYTKRAAETQAKRGLSDLKNKVENSIQQQFKKGIEGLFRK
ncbi:MAG: hypothetical protein EBR01_03915 [Proteobacteria bacterium]|nr:hypothetical protein [Pseudomonadota bacterium]